MKRNLFILSSCFFLGNLASVKGGDLKAPYAMPSAKVLPKGVRNISYKGIMTSASEKYNNARQESILADPFFTDISFQNVIDGKKDPSERGSLTQIMYTMGASREDSFGTTTGQVNIEANAHAPVFALGINNQLTLALAIPFIQASVNVDAGVIQQNPSLHDSFVRTLNQKGVSEKVIEFKEKMVTPIQSKLKDYGYESLQNENVVKLGDLKVISKYQVLNLPVHRLTLTGDLTLPTGEDQKINKVVDVPSGDDQTDIGLGASYDYLLNKKITLSLATHYTLQLPDTNPERIPEKSTSKLSPHIDYSTRRDLGDMLLTQLASSYSSHGFSLHVGYAYQYKQADQYEGNQYQVQRYSWLGNETQQEMHTAQMALGYNTLELFRKKRFPVPLSVALNHTQILAGKNVVKDPLTSLDLSLFF